MPKMSFKNASEGGVAVADLVEAPGAEESESHLPATTRKKELALLGPNPDEIPMEDIQIPPLNISQRVGEMGERHQPGLLIFDGSLVLPKPVRLVVVGVTPTVFVEKLEGGKSGEVYDTEEELIRAGGTLDWNESQQTDRPLFQRMAKFMIFLERPQQLAPTLAFPYEWEGKNYAVAIWTLKATGYTKGARAIFTARKIGALRDDSKGGLRGAFWTLDITDEKWQSKTWYTPKLRLAEETTPEFRAFIKDIIKF